MSSHVKGRGQPGRATSSIRSSFSDAEARRAVSRRQAFCATRGPRLVLESVSFTWPGAPTPLWSPLDLELDHGRYGLVGDNGAGKSTLLSVLAGRLPHEGRVRTRGLVLRVGAKDRREASPPRTSCGTSGLLGPPTWVDALASDPTATPARVRAGLLACPPDAPPRERWATMSAGERQRWLVAGAVWAAPDVLLLDEPEQHLDEAGRQFLIEALGDFGGLALIASHDRDLLDALTTSTLILSGGRLRHLDMSVSPALEVLAREEAAARGRREQLRAEVASLEQGRQRAREVARASEGARTSRRMKGPRDHDGRSMGRKNLANWAAAGHARRARLADDALDEARARLAGAAVRKTLGGGLSLACAVAPQDIVASLEAARIEVGGRLLFEDVRLVVRRSDRIHLAGDNGAGKSTLLARLAASARAGTALHLPQELTPGAVETMLRALSQLSREDRARVASLVAALGTPPSRLFEHPDLSDGEAKKLALALGLVAPGSGDRPRVATLLLDEPDNHLDLASIDHLASALMDWPGALVLVSHDASFARRVTSQRWQIRSGRVWPVSVAPS